MPVTIKEGTTFMVSDERGLPEGPSSASTMRTPASSAPTNSGRRAPPRTRYAATDYFAAGHILTNPALPAVDRGLLGVVRQRLVGRGMHEDLEVTKKYPRR